MRGHVTERKTASPAGPFPPAGPGADRLAGDLGDRVRSLGYGAVAALLRRLLTQMGYTGVAVRRTRQRGRNAFVGGHRSAGGWDLECHWETGLTPQRLIVQLRHTPDRPIQMRCVDELRGALARAGARQGLLVTTGTFSPQAREAAAVGEEVILVDGGHLARLLAEWRVGLRETSPRRWEVDADLFRRLHEQYPGRAGKPTPPGEPPAGEPPPRDLPGPAEGPPRTALTVIVSVGR